jgi:hypothetical protein
MPPLFTTALPPRFTDGGQFGLGQIGISTQNYARGPFALERSGDWVDRAGKRAGAVNSRLAIFTNAINVWWSEIRERCDYDQRDVIR